ncbi:hypothetical protein [Aquisphaera insulae]|uniref:hypothetical protein n=1 Tax=Aquisphaera insulae TaxID=2712864 RepID=UPI0013ECA74B|nr:hypothetical protein [Aquisphaera insulae]
MSTDEMRALIPSAFIPVGEGGPVTPIVVRTARCGGIAVNGGRLRAGTIVQIGAVIVPPDSTGDINNYTLWYYTSNLELAIHLAARGIPAQYVPSLDFCYAPAGPGLPASLRVVVPRPAWPPLQIEGLVTASDGPASSFLANWWVKAGRRVVKMGTSVPEIHIGAADLLLETWHRGPLGRLIGGDTLGFPALQQFNTFAHARMGVTFSSP